MLKGAGVALAVQMMDSNAMGAGSKPDKPPCRLGFIYMPHGVIMEQFWPESTETLL